MGDSLVNLVDSNGVETSKALLASILTITAYNSTRALPVHVSYTGALPVHISPTERLVKKKIDDFTGLAKITAPYMPTSEKPSSINDVINVQNHPYKCMSIPIITYNDSRHALTDLPLTPHSDFVGIKKYVFNPLDENGCAEFDMAFRQDINSLKFCDTNMADKFSVLTLEAFQKQKRLPILNENHEDPIPIYVFFVDNKFSVKYSDTKVNGSSPGSKTIYILHCNSDNDPNKYNNRHRATH